MKLQEGIILSADSSYQLLSLLLSDSEFFYEYIWLHMADEGESSAEVEQSESSAELGLETSNNDDVRSVFGNVFLFSVMFS